MLIRGMQERLGCTSIVVTHDMQSAFYVADRIALLDKGKFIEVSKTEDFKNSPNPKVQQFIHVTDHRNRSDRIYRKTHENRGNARKENTS